jgi:hypothetical protein
MLACQGYGPQDGVWKSTDAGVTWTNYRLSAGINDPYNFDIDPSNKMHTICSSHGTNHVFESNDAGVTWTDKGSAGTGTSSGYVFFITSSIWLYESQLESQTAGTLRTTNAGSSWTQVNNAEHNHGNAQIWINPSNADVYLAGKNGIWRSTTQGATWTQVSTTASSAVYATPSTIYAQQGAASNQPVSDGNPQKAAIGTPGSWASWAVPAGLNNGTKRAAVAFDGTHWVIISGNWLAGIWRYVEP